MSELTNQTIQNPSKMVAVFPRTNSEGYQFEAGVFGVNMEITRKGFFGGICAQMLNNRKLFMGKEGVDGWKCQYFERVLNRPEESLCESNFVILKNGGSMSQTSPVIALQKGKKYEAKAWIKPVSNVVFVTFGVNGLEQTVSVSADDNPYRVLSFVFDGEDINDGTFSLTVKGEAAVFELSLMPTEHFYGMRWDVIEHLRAIAPSSLRFPGGCAADHFVWKESLKAPEFRKPADGLSKSNLLFRDTYHQDPLDIGLNEISMLCKELGAELEYTVSIQLSDGEDARQLVEYCNGDVGTEYGAKRQSLGFDAFNVRLWYVGNEPYSNSWGGIYRDGAVAANRVDELIMSMKRADPTIHVVIPLTWKTKYQTWSFDFVKNIKSIFEYVSYHEYIHDYIGILPDDTQDKDGMANCKMLESNFADGRCLGLDFYREQLYADSFDRIRVCVDEWNYNWGKDSSNALLFSNALQFHFIAKGKRTFHIDRADFFMPINEGMITVRGNQCKMESTGEMFRLMAGHKTGRVIDCDTEDENLDILCTDHRNYLYMSIINRIGESKKLNVEGYRVEKCAEIKVGEYSFESNDYEVYTPQDTVVNGHSILFITLYPI